MASSKESSQKGLWSQFLLHKLATDKTQLESLPGLSYPAWCGSPQKCQFLITPRKKHLQGNPQSREGTLRPDAMSPLLEL